MPSRSYLMYGAFAAGGMASVHLGKLLGPGGFARRVAIKRLHPHLAADPEIAAAFADEARHHACVAHANVAAMLDVVAEGGESLLVMEYVHGETLSRLLGASRRAGKRPPLGVIVSVLADVLHGLHAAHEACDDRGAKLGLVHRDVSPQNVIVGVDGVARVVDFGIAKAMSRSSVTRGGQAKGKMPYMAPEQLLSRAIDRRVDVYASGVILHEALSGARLFDAEEEAVLFHEIVEAPVKPPSASNPAVSPELDAIAMRAIGRHPDRRYATAREMAIALEAAYARAPASVVADWVTSSAREALEKKAALLAEMDRDSPSALAGPGEPAGPTFRAPSASVAFVDVSPAGPAGAPSTPRPIVLDAPAAQASSGRRRTLALAASVAASATLAFVVILGYALTHRAPPPATAVASLSNDFLPVAVAHAAPPAAPPATGSPPPPAAPHAAATPPSPATRWCKVFDAQKKIYVLKATQAPRCP